MTKATYATIVTIIYLIILVITYKGFGIEYVIIEGFVLIFYAIAILRWKLHEIEKMLKNKYE